MAARMLVVSACSGKKCKPPGARLPTSFELDDPDKRKEAERSLDRYRMKAIDLYRGNEHRMIANAMRRIWNAHGLGFAEHYIISAGFGMLKWNEIIFPYDCKFDENSADKNRMRGRMLKIPETFDRVVKKRKLVIVMLGIPYLYALDLPRKLPSSPTIIFLAADKYSYLISVCNNVHFIPAGGALANELSTSARTIKGLVFDRIANKIVKDDSFVDKMIAEPKIIEQLFRKRAPASSGATKPSSNIFNL